MHAPRMDASYVLAEILVVLFLLVTAQNVVNILQILI